MANNARDILVQTTLHHLSQFIDDKEIFIEEFHNIFGAKKNRSVVDKVLRKNFTTPDWLLNKLKHVSWKNVDASNNQILKDVFDNNHDELNEMASSISSKILTYLHRNFENKSLLINGKTLKEKFNDEICAKILDQDEVNVSQGYLNIANKIRKLGLVHNDEKTKKKMWLYYLHEIKHDAKKQNEITIDEITMKALSNILNRDLTYTNENNDEVEVKCDKRPNFSLSIDNKTMRITQLGHGFSQKEQIESLKKNKNYVIETLKINSAGQGSIEEQIAASIFSDKNITRKFNEALNAKKTFMLLVDSTDILDREKLINAMKQELDKQNKNNNVQKQQITVKEPSSKKLKNLPHLHYQPGTAPDSTMSEIKNLDQGPTAVKFEGDSLVSNIAKTEKSILDNDGGGYTEIDEQSVDSGTESENRNTEKDQLVEFSQNQENVKNFRKNYSESIERELQQKNGHSC